MEIGKNQRILVKFSGQMLQSSPNETFSASALDRMVIALRGLIEEKVPCGIVIGAGNLFRGISSHGVGIDRVIGDQIGMLGTVMNALAVREALSQQGFKAHVMSPIALVPSVLPHNPLLARSLIDQNEPVLFAGGTGNPFFTTDSAATLRALEINATLLVKATKVRGVFSADPMKNMNATHYKNITYEKVLSDELAIMDHSSIAMARQYKLPIFVYKFGDPLSITQALQSEDAGTYITQKIQ
jgi:uridylate kinase